MNEQHARELFIEHHRGTLSAGEAAELRAFLAKNPQVQREFEEFAITLNALDAMPVPPPSSRLRAQLLAAIDEEKRAAHAVAAPSPVTVRDHPVSLPRRASGFWILRFVTAGVLLVAGYFVGTHKPALSEPSSELAAVERAAQSAEIAELRRQVQAMNQLVSQTLVQQSQRPTNERLKSVLASAKLENPNEKVINELIGSLTFDPSANVRLTALEALYPHADQDVVRASVLSALPRERSPIVQVAMIDFLTAARDEDAAPTFDRISRSEAIDRNVRDAAALALNQLKF
jgi:anti-sigma factor RsiW